jgi:hypothetical protein
MKTYKAKNGNIQYKQSIDALLDASENNSGFCLACGDEADGVEPDARKYQCSSCNAFKVYGAEELILMGLYYEKGIRDNRSSTDYHDPSTQVHP